MNYTSVSRPSFAPLRDASLDLNFLTRTAVANGRAVSLDGMLSNGRSTPARYVGSNQGALRVAAPGEPRFGYHPRSGMPRGLLIEPLSYNFALASNDFAAGGWVKAGGLITIYGVAAGLDGKPTAWLVSDNNSGTSLGQLAQFISTSGVTPWTGGFHIRRADNFVRVYVRTESLYRSAVFDIGNGRIVSQDAGAIAYIEPAPFDMWKCSVFMFTNGSDTSVGLGLERPDPAGPQNSYIVTEAFLENRPAPSSVMPAGNSYATRAADTYSLALDPSWLNQGDMTIYAEVEMLEHELNGYVAALRDGTTVGTPANYIAILRYNAGPRFAAQTSAGAFIDGLYEADPTGIRRIAFAARSGLYAAAKTGSGLDYIDTAQGVLTSSVLNDLPGGLVALDLGHLGSNGVLAMYLRRLAIIPRVMTPADLSDLLR